MNEISDNKNGIVRNLFGKIKDKPINEVNEALEESDAK